MIIWLASYPKSGNTWLRSLIASYYFSKNGSFDFKLLDNIDQFPSAQFFRDKTDSFLTPEDTSNLWLSEQEKINEELINVFVPTTPNPTSGFLLMLPKKDLIYLNVSFEQASKFIVSAGTTNIN